jgi:hypothetical protein
MNSIYIFKNSVRTSKETHYVSITKPNRLMLFSETVAVYCENHTEHTNTFCGKNAEFWYVKVGGTYSAHCGLTGSCVETKLCFKIPCGIQQLYYMKVAYCEVISKL